MRGRNLIAFALAASLGGFETASAQGGGWDCTEIESEGDAGIDTYECGWGMGSEGKVNVTVPDAGNRVDITGYAIDQNWGCSVTVQAVATGFRKQTCEYFRDSGNPGGRATVWGTPAKAETELYLVDPDVKGAVMVRIRVRTAVTPEVLVRAVSAGATGDSQMGAVGFGGIVTVPITGGTGGGVRLKDFEEDDLPGMECTDFYYWRVDCKGNVMLFANDGFPALGMADIRVTKGTGEGKVNHELDHCPN
ncbi:MAG: hypothetical protein CMJ84_02555 [Planctomycetes bacterium]|jgi:hypothetical protein|nr:hypothetical protein [Planctomycetota bacterium]MDP6408380.1 hypothetical protein [Planctomycetota bacterium]